MGTGSNFRNEPRLLDLWANVVLRVLRLSVGMPLSQSNQGNADKAHNSAERIDVEEVEVATADMEETDTVVYQERVQ